MVHLLHIPETFSRFCEFCVQRSLRVRAYGSPMPNVSEGCAILTVIRFIKVNEVIGFPREIAGVLPQVINRILDSRFSLNLYSQDSAAQLDPNLASVAV